MKNGVLFLVVGGIGMMSMSGCAPDVVYVDRPVYVTPVAKPKPKPRVDNPDNFDAVTRPTTYSN